MKTKPARPERNPNHIKRRHQIQSDSFGNVTVFVQDEVTSPTGRTVLCGWQFSFRPEPGDVIAQVARRLSL